MVDLVTVLEAILRIGNTPKTFQCLCGNPVPKKIISQLSHYEQFMNSKVYLAKDYIDPI